GEIHKMFGGGRNVYFNSGGSFSIDGRSFGGGEGITRSRNIGANYADVYGEKVDVTSDFFYAGSNSDNESVTSRENILPDNTRYFSNSSSRSSSNNDNYNMNVAFDVEIDSTFLINVKPAFSRLKGNTKYSSEENTFDELNALTNQSTSSTNVNTEGKNFRNTIDVTKRFGSKGAFLRWSLTNEINETETEDFLNSRIDIFGTTPETIIRDQFTDSKRDLNSLSTNLTYRIPLNKDVWSLDLKYALRSERRDNVESTFDFDTASQSYSLFNSDLSTDFLYKNIRNTPEVKLRYRKDKFSISTSAGYVFRTLENEDRLRPQLSLKRDFEAVELGSNFNIRFNPKMSIYSGYSLSNTPPQLEQLQPFSDVSDPLNTVTGNPNLEPANSHAVYFGFNNYDFQKGTGIYAYANINVTNNQVVAKTTIDADFVRNTTYANVNGNYNYNYSVGYNKSVKIDSLRTLKIGFGGWSNGGRTINFNNEVQYASKTTSITPNVSLTLNWKKVLEFRPSYEVSFSRTTFDLSDFSNQNFASHNFRIRTATFFPKKLEWRNDIRYNYNPNVADGFQKDSWFWNTTLSYTILKEAGTISVKVYDLLNQNTNASRSATAAYIQDSQSTVLQRYVMFGFSWKFNTLGSKGETNEFRFN
ncbi:MAG: TonB-dependent receptor, partial [Flavobacteriaceae bacterium]|nr:TonB-dependent receptor [Flavobacteriaceae bacterium]